MRFENLRNKLKKINATNIKKIVEALNNEEGLSQYLKWEKKIYKTNPKEKLLKYLINRNNKALTKDLERLRMVEESKDNLPNPLIITIEWRPSRMWRSNPKAFDNYGHESASIGGCGYDKESTATAQVLNQNLTILKALYQEKENRLNVYSDNLNPDKTIMSQSDINRKYLGYGSGYNLIPKFEGGVGVDCYKRILEVLGYEMKHIINTKSTDVYIISKKEVI